MKICVTSKKVLASNINPLYINDIVVFFIAFTVNLDSKQLGS